MREQLPLYGDVLSCSAPTFDSIAMHRYRSEAKSPTKPRAHVILEPSIGNKPIRTFFPSDSKQSPNRPRPTSAPCYRASALERRYGVVVRSGVEKPTGKSNGDIVIHGVDHTRLGHAGVKNQSSGRPKMCFDLEGSNFSQPAPGRLGQRSRSLFKDVPSNTPGECSVAMMATTSSTQGIASRSQMVKVSGAPSDNLGVYSRRDIVPGSIQEMERKAREDKEEAERQRKEAEEAARCAQEEKQELLEEWEVIHREIELMKIEMGLREKREKENAERRQKETEERLREVEEGEKRLRQSEVEKKLLEEEREDADRRQKEAEARWRQAEEEKKWLQEEREKEHLRRAEEEKKRIEEERETALQRQAEDKKKRLEEERWKDRLRQSEEEKKRLEEERDYERLRQADEEEKRLKQEPLNEHLNKLGHRRSGGRKSF